MSDLERDAMRYRWLRETNLEFFRQPAGETSEPGMIDCTMIVVDDIFSQAVDPCEMDDAIDAAMEKWPYHAPTAH
jgi:hypothetical protein